MRTHPLPRTGWLVLFTVLLFAVTLGAQSLKTLPDDLSVTKSADSPGQVVFNHSTHVDSATPDCTTCHPKPFRILKSGSKAPQAPIVHAKMEKGEQCGACHNGKKAFALDEDCTFCHKDK